MQTIRSADGTLIAYDHGGSGPHLVLVHGTSADRRRWGNVRPLLEKQFRVTAIDRRGRGGSGDAGPYAIEREYEDVAAAVEACGAPVLLFGHSYGALCALGAATLARENIAALVLYEAPAFEGRDISRRELARIEALLAADDREGVVTTFAREIVRMPATDFERLKASPAWPARLAAAHTLPRELRAADGFRLASVAPEKIALPTLLLHGGDSPDFFKDAMARLAGLMPQARPAALAGQQHVAMDTAPDLLAEQVAAFWNEVRAG